MGKKKPNIPFLGAKSNPAKKGQPQAPATPTRQQAPKQQAPNQQVRLPSGSRRGG
jgi:hypothetical protein